MVQNLSALESFLLIADSVSASSGLACLLTDADLPRNAARRLTVTDVHGRLRSRTPGNVNYGS